MMRMELTYYIDRGETEIELAIIADVYRAGGDGWNEPRYAESVYIYSVQRDGVEVGYDKEIEDRLVDEILEDIHRQKEEWLSDKAEYIYECRRDSLI